MVGVSAYEEQPIEPKQKMDVKSVCVTGWSDEQICEYVKEEEGAGLVRNFYPL